MGGLGSTRWNGFTKRALVEDCLQLDLVALRREGLLDEPRALRRVEWRNPRTDEVLASAALMIETLADGTRVLGVGYKVSGARTSERVTDVFLLEPRACRFGGLRWLIQCPRGQAQLQHAATQRLGQYFSVVDG